MYKLYFKCGCVYEYKDCKRHKKIPACPVHQESGTDKITFTCPNCGVETDKKAVGGEKITRAGNARQFCEKCHILNSHQCFAIYKHDPDTNKKKAKEIFSKRDLIIFEANWDCANYSQYINKLFNTKAKHLPCKNCSDYIKKALDVMEYARYNSSATATGAFCFTSSRKPKAR